jgi:hypothetical protein
MVQAPIKDQADGRTLKTEESFSLVCVTTARMLQWQKSCLGLVGLCHCFDHTEFDGPAQL